MTLVIFPLISPRVSVVLSTYKNKVLFLNKPPLPMVRAKLFRTNRSQAIRLPKDIAFADSISEVLIFREGARLIVVPADTAWDDVFDRLPIDFPNREQPIAKTRTEP
jgi:antitoxin VapB